MRDRYAARPDVREYQIAQALARYHAGRWVEVQDQNMSLKEEVLTHYGRDGKLQCCWEGCEITDLDMGGNRLLFRNAVFSIPRRFFA